VVWIQEGSVTVDTPVVRYRDAAGQTHSLDLVRRWPVRKPVVRGHAAQSHQ
jgi:V/A-type H+-transporting ATPase subunit A